MAITDVTNELNAVLNTVNELPNSISVDTTLSVSGMAADAKVTGDKIRELSNEKADKETIVAEVLQALGTPMAGTVDENNVITLGGELADGTYTLKYYNEGEYIEIGTLTVGGDAGGDTSGDGGNVDTPTDTPPDTTLEVGIGIKIDRNTGAQSTSSNYAATNFIEIVDGYTYTLSRPNDKYDVNICYYDENQSFMSTSENPIIVTDDGVLTAEIPVIDGAKYFRLRFYFGGAITEGTLQHTAITGTTITATKA